MDTKLKINQMVFAHNVIEAERAENEKRKPCIFSYMSKTDKILVLNEHNCDDYRNINELRSVMFCVHSGGKVCHF